MRELNVKEIEQVNGGWGWLRYLRPTKMGNVKCQVIGTQVILAP